MDLTLIQTEQMIQRVKIHQQPHFREYSVRQQHNDIFRWLIQIFLTQFMHQNGLPQSVSQLALQARVRATAWRGDGDFPLAPIPTDREMEASVSVWECSSDVTGYTASSSNPAGTYATETQFRYHQDGAACYGINKEDASSASGIQSDEKKKVKQEQLIES